MRPRMSGGPASTRRGTDWGHWARASHGPWKNGANTGSTCSILKATSSTSNRTRHYGHWRADRLRLRRPKQAGHLLGWGAALQETRATVGHRRSRWDRSPDFLPICAGIKDRQEPGSSRPEYRGRVWHAPGRTPPPNRRRGGTDPKDRRPQARTVEERGGYFVNMLDPEGNEFDVH